MLTIDGCTRSTWIFLLYHKDAVCVTLKHLFAMTQNLHLRKIKCVRIDNGIKFTNKDCKQLFGDLGILHHKRCVYAPQQNGVVERKHRHLLAATRSPMFQSGLLRNFWGECILMATYLINRLPSRILKWKSPYEMLYNKKPDYTNLRNFGCLVYLTNTKPNKDKFDYRASKGVFISYSSG